MTVEERVSIAARVLGDRARARVPLGPLTTYRVGGAAALFVDAAGLDDLRAVRDAAQASQLPVLVVGRGSNLLVADAGFAGIAVSVASFATDVHVDAEACQVTADAAVALPVLARRTAGAGLTGLEWAVGVPGTVGGGVKMNAGGHGSDMSGTLVDVEVAALDAAEGDLVRVRPAAALGLRFRGSDLVDTDVVIRARFQLQPGDATASKAMLDEIVAWRRANQPGGQNAGSVFVNPVPGEVSAGLLIDDLGLRGHRIGSAEVSTKHANFIQADDGGSADDVVALMREVRRRVAEATGFLLRSEIRLIGFPPDVFESAIAAEHASNDRIEAR